MAIIPSIGASFGHFRNGMTMPDMYACERVAQQLNEVIVFRSTGPWAKRWLQRGHPSKNFHVKGKSSDWGPQAGFIPFDARYSKRPDNSPDEATRTAACRKSVTEGWARAVTLTLSRPELHMQLNLREGREVGIRRQVSMGADMILYAGPQGSPEEYVFLARAMPGKGEIFEILVYNDQTAARGANPFKLADAKGGNGLSPLLVMASNEAGSDDKPITGDYDLFAVVPTWAAYGSRTSREISKPGVQLRGAHGQQQGQTFAAGVGMDNVLDGALHTFGGGGRIVGPARNASTYAQWDAALVKHEHHDMGNITPRVLRAINALNGAMGAAGGKGWRRRVHHNAENYRHAMFGAMTMADMLDTRKGGGGFGDGFPLTAFQPPGYAPLAPYGTCCTIESYADLQDFLFGLHQAGFYVPKNSAWRVAKAYELAGRA